MIKLLTPFLAPYHTMAQVKEQVAFALLPDHIPDIGHAAEEGILDPPKIYSPSPPEYPQFFHRHDHHHKD